ncbi:MAG: hypothetical protein ACR2Q4_17885, partial [Geminicoccaceae bacterium]
MRESFVDLDRRFLDVTYSGQIDESPASMLFARSNGKQGAGWAQILENDGIIILGSAGSGKTTEILNQARIVRNSGRPAFVLRLENLCRNSGEESFFHRDLAAEESYKDWLKNGGMAVAFLDALDEARLPDARNLSILRHALANLSKSIGRRSRELRIVLTTRPSEWHGASDFDLFQQYLTLFRNLGSKIVSNREKISGIKIKAYQIAELELDDVRKLAANREIDTEQFLD